MEKTSHCTKYTKKNYADNRKRELTFQIGDHVFLKVSPTKGVMRFEA